jgi:hypothetical protein
MKLKTLLLILLLSVSLSGGTYAGEISYECTIGNVYELTDTGRVKETHQNWQSVFQGERFYVSRLSGEIVGSTLPTTVAKEVRVVNPGSTEYDFQTISIYDHPNSEKEWQILSIKEFKDGDKKPFIAFAASGITTGMCK